MLIERGRYFYQRKIPLELQPAVGRKKWRSPLGQDFDQAYEKLRDLAKEHDALIERLADPIERQDHKTKTRRAKEDEKAVKDAAADAAYAKWCVANGHQTDAEEFQEAFPDFNPNDAWKDLPSVYEGLELERKRHLPPDANGLAEKKALIERIHAADFQGAVLKLPPFSEFKEMVTDLPDHLKAHVRLSDALPTPMDDDEYHDRLTDAFNGAFGEQIQPPINPNERDEFDFARMGLERKIARVARDPDVLRRVAEKFYAFAELRPKTEDKYRRTIERFIADAGNIPVSQVTAKTLRDYRDKLKSRGLLPSSIRAEFSPIMGLFGYAVDEELIEISPMVSVKLPKERRAVEESKWLPFDTEECGRIFAALSDIWGQPVQGLTEERRTALQMAVRVLAHSAMRPAEFMALRSDQVDERAIRVEGGKTKSSWRVIPLHPNIEDFPSWLHSGGMNAFHNTTTGEQQTDTVTVLRHNFAKLIRKKMRQPITNRRKTLYSLRSTFQNAMRRAGAPKDVRRAILGHVESGAIRHYDDGPEFELLKHWVERSDPCK